MTAAAASSQPNDGKITLALLGQKMDNVTQIVQGIDDRLRVIETTSVTQLTVNTKAIERLEQAVDCHDDDIDNLKVKTSWWNGANTLGAIIAAILGGIGISNK